jgi:hypothetical protein
VEKDGQPSGPLTLEQIRQEIADKKLTQQTLVWKAGQPNWVPAGQDAGLKALFAAIPPAIPPENRWREFMVGTWRVQAPMAAGMAQQMITTQYRPDGTYAGVLTMQMPGAPATSQPLGGTWKVQAIDNESFTLTLTGPGQIGQSVSLRRVDENTLANEAEGYEALRVGP